MHHGVGGGPENVLNPLPHVIYNFQNPRPTHYMYIGVTHGQGVSSKTRLPSMQTNIGKCTNTRVEWAWHATIYCVVSDPPCLSENGVILVNVMFMVVSGQRSGGGFTGDPASLACNNIIVLDHPPSLHSIFSGHPLHTLSNRIVLIITSTTLQFSYIFKSQQCFDLG